MFDEQARAFLQQPLTARLSSNGHDGYPHTVPIWFMLDGDEIVLVSERGLRKVKNLERDPRAAVQIGGDDDHEAGYLIRGEVTMSDDVGNALTNRLTYHYEDKETAEKHIAEWASLDMLVLRLKPVSVRKVY